MPRLRSLAGDELLRILAGFGFRTVSQRGSHVKVRRVIQGSRQTLTIILHDEVDKGTLRAIYRQALRFIVNIRIPESAPAGDEIPLRLSMPNGRSDSVLIAIRP